MNRLAKPVFLPLIALLASALLGIAHAQQDEGADMASAIYAGGCFWCIEADFEKLDGVVEAISGYSGGTLENPSYEQVSHTETGHYEVVKVIYDPQVVSYRELTDYFFRHIDPFDAKGQFCDKGSSYLSAVFAANGEERAIAEKVKQQGEALLGKNFVTPVLDRAVFWPAEDYHQDYYKKNPRRYKFYRTSCGRDARVKRIWGKQ